MNEQMKETLVRQCATYNPYEHISRYPTHNPDNPDEVVEYMEVKHRIDWFVHWAEENHIIYHINDSYEIMPELGLVIGTTDVSIEGGSSAKSSAAREFITSGTDEAYTERYVSNAVQTALTFATGRALARLGFGTINGTSAENGENYPPDAGNRVAEPVAPPVAAPTSVEEASKNAFGADGSSTPVVPETPKRGRGRPRKNPPSTDVTTPNGARALIMPMGHYAGRSLGEAYAENSKILDYYLDPSRVENIRSRHPEVITACETLRAEENQGKSL